MQPTENKEVTKSFPLKTAQEEEQEIKQKEPGPSEKTVVIRNEKIEATLTTLGGSISKTKILDYSAELPVKGIFELESFKGLEYEVEKEAADEVVFVAQKNGLEIRKIYRLSDGDFILNVDLEVRNSGINPVAFSPGIQTMMIDITMAGEEVERSRDRNLLEYSVLSDGKVVRKTGAFKFTKKENKQTYAPVDWFGFRNRYYCAIFKPEFVVQGYRFLPYEGEKQLSVHAILNDITLNGGESINFPSVIYVGPQNSEILKAYDMDFDKIQVYFRAAFFDSIAKIIEDIIKVIYKIIPNWGVSIILVSLMIYLCLYPLTMKSMLSMRKMQSLQPKIAELREKHEKNPQKLNQDIMKLYAENKVNPMGGCLPILLQMPVFICLYQMIWRSVLFKGAGFLWIKDLSQPDRLIILSKSFPIIGNEINVLPLVILVLMFIQQKMTAKNMNVTDPNQLAQQKMMTFMMPAILFLVFYRIASGLSLYFTVFYIVSSLTQWRIGKKDKAVS